MHAITIVRAYLNLSQVELAKLAGVTQTQLSQMETKRPWGDMDKYQRVARALGIPVDVVVKNDLNQIPMSFFETHPEPAYKAVPKTGDGYLGRQGEEYIFQREKDRLKESFPVLGKLVIPFFKKKGRYIGYDILSFDEMGKPLCLEVKTSTINTGGFNLSQHELDTAERFKKMGQKYVIVYITNWDTPEQEVRDLDFAGLKDTHIIDPSAYFCRPIPKDRSGPINGLAYFRRLRGLRQSEIAKALEVRQGKWSLYENGHQAPYVDLYLRASELLDATLDELLAQYDASSVDMDDEPA